MEVANPAIPRVITTGGGGGSVGLSPDDVGTNFADEAAAGGGLAMQPHPDISSRLRVRETNVNYAESAKKKRVCSSSSTSAGFPTADPHLGDYISTFFGSNDDQPLGGYNPGSYLPPPSQAQQQESVELAGDAWRSLYGGGSSMAAVAPRPSAAAAAAAARVDDNPPHYHW